MEIWDEPARGSHFDPALLGRSGLEVLQSLTTGESKPPPIGRLTGMQLTEVGAGTSTFTMPVSGWLVPPQGAVSGGVLAVLADGPFGCAIHSTLPARVGYTTAELSLTLLRAVRPGGVLTARGRAIHTGRTMALSEVAVTDDRGRLVAHGTSRCAVFPPSSDPPPAGTRAAVVEAEPASPDPYLRPVEGAVLPQEVWDSLDGRAVLEAQLRGDLPMPPIHSLFGLTPVDVGEEAATFSLHCSEWLTSPLGTVEGGTIALVADSALQAAVQTTVPAGTAFAPVDLKVNFLRPVFPDGRDLTARGTVVQRGRSLAIARAEVVNADGKVVALASGSAMYLPGRRADLEGVVLD